jgi:RsbRD-like negative regulator of sigma factor
MPPTTLIELLETQADALTAEALKELITHPRTTSFRGVPREEVTTRVRTLLRTLAGWITKPDDDAIRAAFEDWGRTRFKQSVPLSEVAYAVLLAKDHLRRRAGAQGLTEAAGLEHWIGEFFDRALYYLMRGYEMQAATPPRGT